MPKSSNVEQIRQLASGRLPEIAEALGIRVRRKAAQCWIHDDKVASVWFQKDYFKCHVCGDVKGDVFKLVMSIKNVPFKEAISWLESYFKIDNNFHGQLSSSKAQSNPAAAPKSPEPQLTPEEEKRREDIRRKIIADFYSLCLPIGYASPKYMAYMKGRGISENTLDFYRVRVLDDAQGVEKKLREKYEDRQLLVSGLFVWPEKRHGLYFMYKNLPIIFPLWRRGMLLTVQGRAIVDGNIKYLTAGGRIPCLYNHDALDENVKEVYLCEGIPDTLSMHEMGKQNVVGILGVQNFKTPWYADFRGKKVIICLDNDPGGYRAYQQIKEEFAKYKITTEKAKLPLVYNDVNDYLKAKKGLPWTPNPKKEQLLKELSGVGEKNGYSH